MAHAEHGAKAVRQLRQLRRGVWGVARAQKSPHKDRRMTPIEADRWAMEKGLGSSQQVLFGGHRSVETGATVSKSFVGARVNKATLKGKK